MVGQRARRLTTTVFVVVALLFSQLALASYACPPQPVQADAMPMAGGEPCEGMDMQVDEGQPVLCHQHCVNAPQSFEPIHLPTLSLPAIVQVLVVQQFVGGTPDESRLHADTGQMRPPPDPLFLSTLRLRV
ncbi:hypothetical protein [Ramlibacter sp.]|uniref:hypothetical protein n=1 Tax=Ramlibacter sp. TaxID=1917967 RepID=UPI002D351D62|nr:hypothetical protein [Ramlibacter sp.]HYD75307.1 hypothetical protein [Ramlibacter sp.]